MLNKAQIAYTDPMLPYSLEPRALVLIAVDGNQIVNEGESIGDTHSSSRYCMSSVDSLRSETMASYSLSI